MPGSTVTLAVCGAPVKVTCCRGGGGEGLPALRGAPRCWLAQLPRLAARVPPLRNARQRHRQRIRTSVSLTGGTNGLAVTCTAQQEEGSVS